MQCSTCKVTYGMKIGDMAPCRMYWKKVSFTCDGEPAGTPTWEIEYASPAGIVPATGVRHQGDFRRAYIPDNEEGREVLALLVKCFKRRLTLTLGFSQTRNCDNTIIWNGVHHKSYTNRGAANHGYPDPSYFTRVKQELTLKGITWSSEQEKDEMIDEITTRVCLVQVGDIPRQ